MAVVGGCCCCCCSCCCCLKLPGNELDKRRRRRRRRWRWPLTEHGNTGITVQCSAWTSQWNATKRDKDCNLISLNWTYNWKHHHHHQLPWLMGSSNSKWCNSLSSGLISWTHSENTQQRRLASPANRIGSVQRALTRGICTSTHTHSLHSSLFTPL